MEVPHMGQMTVNAIVYKQLPDGQFSPQAVWHDAFQVSFVEETPDECIKKIKEIIEELKSKYAK